ncbi:MAG: hypothetical protein QT02_C0010G0013 [archaeon GW2011_AR9]|nr:MAG: hypothetical protein QT02_C0010G0013 [archaeon GW2011_AR9]MBS3120147.1 hypothetical protein [Candidatus Woesearchaeota archaeon]HIG92842.1 hypothetical protein [Candidatus Woesearchaeota archaeon]HIH12226.1 hypothetical protein [Candidatus Woesearchaeota archaeon]
MDDSTLFSHQEVTTILEPLLKKLISLHRSGKTSIIGIQGGQGTGKTTLSALLKQKLEVLGYTTKSFSIDDFYETYAHRRQLARKYSHNPFYAISRGLPGTHRVAYLHETLRKIKQGKNFSLPIFDKSLHHAAGDVLSKTIPVRGRQDFILFEGWCVGIPVVSSSTLVSLCRKNNLDLQQLDPTLEHHKVVLQYLKQYQPLWKYLDYTLMLRPDSMDFHQQWRYQQEKELRQKTGRGMTKTEIDHFVGLFLPFTYLCYEKIKPDVRILINKKHEWYKMTISSSLSRK